MITQNYSSLFERIESGECILIDGATGTECERRGVPQVINTWNSGAALSHPDIVRTIHREYIDCGAEIVITNTFSSSRHCLKSAGIEHKFEDLTNTAVQLAKEARDQSGKPNVLIAGGITHWIWTDDIPSLQELENNTKDQAELMARGGCDLIMLEMLSHVDRLIACIEGAKASGLPVWPGISVEPRDGKMCLLGGESLVEAISVIKQKEMPVINIMHTEVAYIDECLDILDAHWDGVVGIYAHVCRFSKDDTKAMFDNTISPVDYAVATKRWIERGVKIVGGCCGVRKEHICELQHVI